MNHMQVLKRAWRILFSYRALWVFGIILALTSASFNGNGNNGSSQSSGQTQANNPNFQLPANLQSMLDQASKAFSTGIPTYFEQNMVWIVIILVCFILLIGVVFSIARYVSNVAIIRMVDGYEGSGEKLSWKQGLRLGWSRDAWRLFLIDLVVFIPIILGIVILGGCFASLVLLGGVMGQAPSISGMVAAVGIAFLVIFALLALSMIISLVIEIVRRTCVLQNMGVTESIRQGWKTVRTHLKDVGLMWLILIGIQIGYSVAIILVVILLLGIGLALGGGLGLLLYFIAQAMGGATAGWVAAATGGGLLFLLIMGLPLLFLGGLKETYLSTVWTLTYREVMALALPNLSLPDEGGNI